MRERKRKNVIGSPEIEDENEDEDEF